MEHNSTGGSVYGHTHNHGLPIGNEGLFVSNSYLGTFVFGIGLWWWIQSARNRFLASRRSNRKYASRASHGSRCCRNQLTEGLMKLCLCFIGIAIEAMTEKFDRHHEYAHYPFYAAYLLAGLVNVLQSTVVYLPDDIEYVCELLPFVFQAYCLRAQAYDQPHVTANCRFLSSYLGVLVAASIIFEMGCRDQFLFSWLKCFTVMLSGAWTCQMGVILNPPTGKPWDEDNHDNVMYLAIVCAWQMFGVALLQLVTLVLMARCQGVSPDWTDFIDSSQVDQQHSTGNRNDIQYAKLLNDDSLSE